MFLVKALFLTLALTAMPQLSQACGAADPRVEEVATTWLAIKPQQSLADLTPSDGICFRQQLMERLADKLGPVVGYKVGVYTQAARKTYGASRPAVGVLRQKMLFDAGVTVSASSGVASLSEADFLLVIKDDGINTATTREEAYQHLRGYRAFVELPDLNYIPTPKPSLGQLLAINVSARAGVMGKEVPLPQTSAGLAGLTQLAVDVVVDAPGGPVTARGVAKETLGDPLEIVLAARDGLKAEGVALKAGDVISIGTITPARPVKAGETLTIHYTVAPSSADIAVKFVP
jgi:2-keto-4-pentenoate hydratase